MQDGGASEENLGLPQALGENVLSCLPINIPPRSLQIGVPHTLSHPGQAAGSTVNLQGSLSLVGKEVAPGSLRKCRCTLSTAGWLPSVGSRV